MGNSYVEKNYNNSRKKSGGLNLISLLNNDVQYGIAILHEFNFLQLILLLDAIIMSGDPEMQRNCVVQSSIGLRYNVVSVKLLPFLEKHIRDMVFRYSRNV